MANEKYDNLTVLMTTGKLNWVGDPIMAHLMMDCSFDPADVTLEDAGGKSMQMTPIMGRSVDPTGSLLGTAVSFRNMPRNINFQMLIVKDGGPGSTSSLLAFYDTDANGQPLTLKNNGTLIVRPEALLPAEDTGQGAWVKI